MQDVDNYPKAWGDIIVMAHMAVSNSIDVAKEFEALWANSPTSDPGISPNALKRLMSGQASINQFLDIYPNFSSLTLKPSPLNAADFAAEDAGDFLYFTNERKLMIEGLYASAVTARARMTPHYLLCTQSSALRKYVTAAGK